MLPAVERLDLEHVDHLHDWCLGMEHQRFCALGAVAHDGACVGVCRPHGLLVRLAVTDRVEVCRSGRDRRHHRVDEFGRLKHAGHKRVREGVGDIIHALFARNKIAVHLELPQLPGCKLRRRLCDGALAPLPEDRRQLRDLVDGRRDVARNIGPRKRLRELCAELQDAASASVLCPAVSAELLSCQHVAVVFQPYGKIGIPRIVFLCGEQLGDILVKLFVDLRRCRLCEIIDSLQLPQKVQLLVSLPAAGKLDRLRQ